MGLLNNKKLLGVLIVILTMLILFPSFFTSCTNQEIQNIFLTDEEQQWLVDHEGQIKIGYTTDYPPVEFLEGGNYVGMSADYFQLLEEKLNTKIEMVEFEHWNELVEQAKNREISGITAATKTPERSEYLDFTVPYILNPNVIITRENFSEQLTFDKLANSTMEVLVVEDYAIIEYLDKNYPNLSYSKVISPSDGLRKVSFGEADAMVIEIMSASASIDRDNLSNLIVNTETPYESNLSIAIRNDWPILSDILNKGLAQITEDERQAIKSKWIPFERESVFATPYFGMILASIMILLIFIITIVTIWNYTLKKAVKEQTSDLENYKDQLLKEIEERKKTEEKIIYKSYHDELTGIYNRAFFNEKFVQLDREECLPLSIILADLNGLKITNDTSGHQTGDRLLIQISRILENVFRETDIIARIGGDEFVILLPNTSKDTTRDLCDRVKEACLNCAPNPIKPSVALGYETKTDMSSDMDIIFKHAEDNMYEHKIGEREHISTTILESLEALLRETTNESFEHSQRIRVMAFEMGKILKLSEDALDALSLLADLHDLGKLAISEDILQKEGPLTTEEWDRIKKHPELGYKIANALPELSQIAMGILSHHEHWDGYGYPQGLEKEEIPLIARIISIADAYDVMTTGRPYKPALKTVEAISELKNCAGKQFDPALVELFVTNVLQTPWD